MEINSANVYLRSRIMLCFDDEKLKDENTFKGNSQAEYFIKVLCSLKTRDVSYGVYS